MINFFIDITLHKQRHISVSTKFNLDPVKGTFNMIRIQCVTPTTAAHAADAATKG